MTDQVTALKLILQTIRREVAPKHDAAPAGWERNALGTILQNIDRYEDAINEAAMTKVAEQSRQAACKVSGIRKGISDLGVLHPKGDQELIDLIDEADTLATSICTSTAP